VKNTVGTDENYPQDEAAGQWARLHAQQRTYNALREAGVPTHSIPRVVGAFGDVFIVPEQVRVAIGGDYGFRLTPQGEQAADIEYFVEHFGYSAIEALECATAVGGELLDNDE
jgi:hypothetical protein